MRHFLYSSFNTEERVQQYADMISAQPSRDRRERAKGHLTWWEDQLQRDRTKVLERRRQEFGIEGATTLDVIGLSDADMAGASANPPRWMAVLNSILDRLGPEGPDQSPIPVARLGLMGFAWPWLSHARVQLQRKFQSVAARAPLAVESLEAGILHHLVDRIHAVAQRTMTLELNVARARGELSATTPDERFHLFCSNGCQPATILKWIEEYPVLGRLLTQETESLISFTAEILEHYAADREFLPSLSGSAEPGQLAHIGFGAGDRHCGGKSVSILTMQDGARYVYKPRSIRVDVLFADLIVLLEANGLACTLRTPRIIERGSYGWSQFIEHEVCGDPLGLQRFYTRIGELLAIVHCLYGSDIHYENLIAAGENPIVLDLECLFCQARMDDKNNQEAVLPESYAHTVLFTHLLPGRPMGGADGAELSGLSTCTGGTAPFENIVKEG